MDPSSQGQKNLPSAPAPPPVHPSYAQRVAIAQSAGLGSRPNPSQVSESSPPQAPPRSDTQFMTAVRNNMSTPNTPIVVRSVPGENVSGMKYSPPKETSASSQPAASQGALPMYADSYVSSSPYVGYNQSDNGSTGKFEFYLIFTKKKECL
jgi:hypothetical protein